MSNIAAGKETLVVTGSIAAGSGVSLSSNTPKTVTSVLLDPGTYDIEGTIGITPSVGSTSLVGGASLVDNTLGGEDERALFFAAIAGISQLDFPRKRHTFTVQTRVYLIGQSAFASGTCVAWGTINAFKV